MRFGGKIQDGGWGALILTIYSFFVLYLASPQEPYHYLIAAVPTLSVMFMAKIFSSQLINFFAGGELKRSTEKVFQLAGEDFYEGTSEEIQSRVDDLDDRAYKENISILSGLAIGLTAPIFGYVGFSTRGGALGVVIAVLALQVLSKKGIESLNELARGISRPYEAKHENQ